MEQLNVDEGAQWGETWVSFPQEPEQLERPPGAISKLGKRGKWPGMRLQAAGPEGPGAACPSRLPRDPIHVAGLSELGGLRRELHPWHDSQTSPCHLR